jgi:hypothetical protein
MVGNPLFFAASLYKKLTEADQGTREQVKSFLRDIVRSGAIPLGMRRTVSGGEYWWVVYDRHKLGRAELDSYLADHTPPGLKMVVLSI